MNPVFQRLLQALVVTGGVLVAWLALVVPLRSSADTESPCAALQRWAQVYSGTAPRLDEFAQFDRSHRIAIFNAVSPEVRAALAQAHLRRFQHRADLSVAQRALIEEAMAYTTPAFYVQDPTARRQSDAFWRRVQLAFATPELRHVWLDVGGPVSPAPTQAVPSLVSLVIPAPRAASQVPPCECSHLFYNECGGTFCVTGGCSVFLEGCGFASQYACDGLCQ